MRRSFAKELLKHAKKDKDIVLITLDLGFGMWDQFKKELPGQYYNLGASEIAGVGIAVGMALEGKKPFVYSITNFLLYRSFETIRNYIDHESIPVRLVGSGRNSDYSDDGFSHQSNDAHDVLGLWSGIKIYWADDKKQIPLMAGEMVKHNRPSFISLRR